MCCCERDEGKPLNSPSGPKQPRDKRARTKTPTPDVFDELKQRGEEEFGFWLRSFELVTLKAIVKQNGFDPGKKLRAMD